MSLLLAAACTGRPIGPHAPSTTLPQGPPPILTSAPAVTQPATAAPYSRHVTMAFDRPVTLAGWASDGVHTIPIATGSSPEQELSLVGLYADRRWEVDLVASAEDGQQTRVPTFSFSTAPLPYGWPEMDLVVATPDVEPGFTLLPVIHQDLGGQVPEVADQAWLAVVDARGEVAWLWGDARFTKYAEAIPVDGGVLAMAGDDEIVELDWEGNLIRAVGTRAAVDPAAIPTDLPIYSHELRVLPDGTWLTMTRESLELAEYPTDYTDPLAVGPATVGADRIVEIDPATGAVRSALSIAGALDPLRIGYNSLDDTAYGLDWTHANAVTVDPVADTYIVSLRHQDAVISLDRSTGVVDWILANHDNWDPGLAVHLLTPGGAAFEWPWHQHAVKWLGSGDLVLFDNRNAESSPFTGVPEASSSTIHSRIVAFHVDESTRTVTQKWAFEPDPYLYCPAMGDVDVLSGGTVLADFANVRYRGGKSSPTSTAARCRSRSSSSTRPTAGWCGTSNVWAPEGAAIEDWRSFRAERFASFGAGGPLP